jgi:hypothetical protein
MTERVEAITPSTIVVRSRSITSAPIGHETAMLNIEQGRYYGLDDIGTYIWQLLEEPQSVDQVCTRLLARYDVDAGTCQQHAIAFLKGLLKAGVVDVTQA